MLQAGEATHDQVIIKAFDNMHITDKEMENIQELDNDIKMLSIKNKEIENDDIVEYNKILYVMPEYKKFDLTYDLDSRDVMYEKTYITKSRYFDAPSWTAFGMVGHYSENHVDYWCIPTRSDHWILIGHLSYNNFKSPDINNIIDNLKFSKNEHRVPHINFTKKNISVDIKCLDIMTDYDINYSKLKGHSVRIIYHFKLWILDSTKKNVLLHCMYDAPDEIILRL